MGKDAPGRRDRRVGIEDIARCREELSLSLSLSPEPDFQSGHPRRRPHPPPALVRPPFTQSRALKVPACESGLFIEHLADPDSVDLAPARCPLRHRRFSSVPSKVAAATRTTRRRRRGREGRRGMFDGGGGRGHKSEENRKLLALSASFAINFKLEAARGWLGKGREAMPREGVGYNGIRFLRAIVPRTQRGRCAKWNKADGGAGRFKAVGTFSRAASALGRASRFNFTVRAPRRAIMRATTNESSPSPSRSLSFSPANETERERERERKRLSAAFARAEERVLED